MPGENEVEIDMGSALDDISAGLGFNEGDDDDDGRADADLDNLGDSSNNGTGLSTEPSEGVARPEGTAAPGEGGTKPEPTAGLEGLAEPPKTWRKEAAATWAALPAEAKQEILKREEDMFRGLEGYKADAAYGKSFKGVLDPYLPILRQHGIDPVRQVAGLMEAHYTLAMGNPQQKQALFQKLATEYGIELPQAGGDPPFVDPAVQGLQTEVNTLKSQLSADKQARDEATRQEIVKEIERFASDKANVHFEAVADDMTTLLQKGVCKTLAEAYDKAVWANPATRAKEIDRQQTERTEKARKEAEAKTAAAKKATAANVRTSAKRGAAAGPVGSMDDTLNETLANILSRENG